MVHFSFLLRPVPRGMGREERRGGGGSGVGGEWEGWS